MPPTWKTRWYHYFRTIWHPSSIPSAGFFFSCWIFFVYDYTRIPWNPVPASRGSSYSFSFFWCIQIQGFFGGIYRFLQTITGYNRICMILQIYVRATFRSLTRPRCVPGTSGLHFWIPQRILKRFEKNHEKMLKISDRISMTKFLSLFFWKFSEFFNFFRSKIFKTYHWN